MESLRDVLEIVALAAVSVLCVYLVVVLVRVRSILALLEREMKELSARALPVMENLEVITDRVKSITDDIDEQVNVVKSAIQSFKVISENIADFERRVQDRIEEPVMETVGTFAAIFRGLRTFVTRLRA
ncbi:MAG TPA: DUF948 domain-containing protein [Bacteroidota bacterium]|nr:DUF948 domain-containing protein [Bacteroidota bacterium]